MPRPLVWRWSVFLKSMFNLLPLQEKKLIRREYFTRLAIIFGVFTFVSLLMALALLVPSYFLSRVFRNEAKQSLNSLARSNAAKDTEALSKEIAFIAAAERALSNTHPVVAVSDLFSAITLARNGTGVRIFSLRFNRDNTGSGISVTGEAGSREDLLLLRKKLEDSDFFANVELPISNFAKGKKIDFSVILTNKP